jgi:pimeloyl-ACP methyl ester carboxylesterase
LLDADVKTAFEQSGGHKVILLANSQGAAVTRGFLAYSNDANDGVAAGMVDSVVFMEGAHSGSYLAFDISRHPNANRFAPIVDALTTSLGAINPTRPAVKELTPKSAWYQWTNPTPSHLPNLPYFNVYGDINVVQDNCFFFIFNCHLSTVDRFGDAILLAGDNSSPLAVPSQGSARFLNGLKGAQNFEWSMPSEVLYDPGSDPFFIGAVAHVVSQPQFHGSFGKNVGSIQIPDCRGGGPISVSAEMLRVVVGREQDAPYACQP